MNPKETGTHVEVDHDLLSDSRPNADKDFKISIVPRGSGALGFTQQLPTGAQANITRATPTDPELWARTHNPCVVLQIVSRPQRSSVGTLSFSGAIGPGHFWRLHGTSRHKTRNRRQLLRKRTPSK